MAQPTPASSPSQCYRGKSRSSDAGCPRASQAAPSRPVPSRPCRRYSRCPGGPRPPRPAAVSTPAWNAPSNQQAAPANRISWWCICAAKIDGSGLAGPNGQWGRRRRVALYAFPHRAQCSPHADHGDEFLPLGIGELGNDRHCDVCSDNQRAGGRAGGRTGGDGRLNLNWHGGRVWEHPRFGCLFFFNRRTATGDDSLWAVSSSTAAEVSTPRWDPTLFTQVANCMGGEVGRRGDNFIN